jgi:hypothetical protein
MSSKHQKQFMDEALIEQPAVEDHEGAWPSLLTIIGFAFLTFNSFMAVYRSNGDVGAIFFVVFSYLDLVLLFYCLRQYERTPPESPRREHIKMAVWLLTTLLTAAFSYKVAAIMPHRQHLHKPTIPTPLYHRLPGASVLIPQSRPVGVARSPVLGDQGSASLLFLPSFLGSACSFEPPPHRPLVRAHPIDYASWKNIPYT